MPSETGCSSELSVADKSQMQVRMDLLPPEITDDMPVSILFIGKAVRALSQPGSSLSNDHFGAAAALDSLQAAPAFDAGRFELVIEKIRAQVGRIGAGH